MKLNLRKQAREEKEAARSKKMLELEAQKEGGKDLEEGEGTLVSEDEDEEEEEEEEVQADVTMGVQQ